MKTRILSVAALISLAIWTPSYEYKVKVVFEDSKDFEFIAVQLNELGQIVGALWDLAPNKLRAAIWTDGNLRTFEGLGYNTWAEGINDFGTICGTAFDAQGTQWPALWRADGSFEKLEIGTVGGALRVTEDERVFGWWGRRSSSQPFFYRDGKAIDLPLRYPSEESSIFDMADNGYATGIQHEKEGSVISQWLWRPGEAKVTETPFWIVDLNATGLGCGTVADNNEGYAGIYDCLTGRVRHVPDPDTTATSLNDFGVLVGSVFVNNDGDYGMIWEDVGKPGKRLSSLIDPKLGLEIGRTVAINNAGQILAIAFSVDRKRSFDVLLEPTKATKRNSVVPTDRFWKVDP